MNKHKSFAVLIALALFLSACGGSATPDAAAIATSAVQTVEARYTATAQAGAQASVPPTETSAPVPTAAATSDSTATPIITSTPQPVDSNGKPCYAASVQDLTIPDGMLISPGFQFTKTWRMLNLGNCVWDSTYALTFDSGDAMGTVLKVPLTTRVLPGQSVDISVDLTAPTTEGTYKGYWRMSTPFGGTFGVGKFDQSIYVEILVSSKPKRDTGAAITSIGLYSRLPQNGCSPANVAATYTFEATITANGPIPAVTFHWNQFPNDGSKPFEYKIKFADAGSQTVRWSWTLQHESIENITRYVSLTIDGGGDETSARVPFLFTCSK